ncbi:hypothetical protein [Streptacidiphilus sp. PAMC 29251]
MHWLATWFIDLFTTANLKIQTLLNYGIAALFSLIAGGIARRTLKGIG